MFLQRTMEFLMVFGGAAFANLIYYVVTSNPRGSPFDELLRLTAASFAIVAFSWFRNPAKNSRK